jgi:hypothetical protein
MAQQQNSSSTANANPNAAAGEPDSKGYLDEFSVSRFFS